MEEGMGQPWSQRGARGVGAGSRASAGGARVNSAGGAASDRGGASSSVSGLSSYRVVGCIFAREHIPPPMMLFDIFSLKSHYLSSDFFLGGGNRSVTSVTAKIGEDTLSSV